MKNKQFKEFRIDDIFKKIKTNNLPYKANECKKEPDAVYCLPALTAGIENQGLSCYVPKVNATILKNVISVSANGANTGAMFYQPNEFTVLQDSYAIKYKDDDVELNEKIYLYLITCMQKVIKGNYNWSKKAGWERIRSCKILIPIRKEYIPDFDVAEHLFGGGITMQKIDTSTWKEFSLSTLFDSSNGDVDLQQKDINNKGNFVISSGEQNNGVIGKTDVKAKIFSSNTITIDMFGNVFYRDFDYKMVTHARVFSLNPKFKMTEKIGLFIVSCLSSLKQLYSYSNMCNWTKIQDMKILLPSKEIDVPDFEYMEQYISELEQERISELEQYLLTTGLNDYELTEEDKNLIIKKVEFKDFKLENLFKWQNQKEINPLKIDELSIKNENKYPFYGQSTCNNGIISYLSLNKNVLNNENSKSTILIHSNNQNIVYVDTPFYLKDGHGATSVLQSSWLNKYRALYIISCIKKIISKMFSYQNKATKIALKNLEIKLPIKIDENNNPIIDTKYTYHRDGYIPDFEYMEKYIKVQEKLVIKDVVLFKDKIIDKTKTIVNNN